MVGTCECGNEPSDSIQNVGNFLTSCIRLASQERLFSIEGVSE
jgi:hypothetical protein